MPNYDSIIRDHMVPFMFVRLKYMQGSAPNYQAFCWGLLGTPGGPRTQHWEPQIIICYCCVPFSPLLFMKENNPNPCLINDSKLFSTSGGIQVMWVRCGYTLVSGWTSCDYSLYNSLLLYCMYVINSWIQTELTDIGWETRLYRLKKKKMLLHFLAFDHRPVFTFQITYMFLLTDLLTQSISIWWPMEITPNSLQISPLTWGVVIWLE